ncbi:type IV pili methyl-accepting chemotaxis transducer N-terminal domain-containing protein [Helicobacter sp. 11S03491-1]|uniref:type IV pili methyl-accepting chemotaxis transducer N-terminal domain-containing protein n=1 Tax=Helicobacter sp. 11S03491-1 TaxID=1476196 RepID=UPI000BDA3F92|nr:type IV pili methyl-accepting chemotaxis transducer N-terminal domain-containing protein [Helicobacter sp. 11S03491-1]PAF41670.1 hypothetical protein BKH45_06150 [Helicobacter sp. 11S03491-1]
MKLAFKNPISSRLAAIAGTTFIVVFIVMTTNIYLNKENLALSGILNSFNQQIRLSQTILKETYLRNYKNSKDFNELNQEMKKFEEKFNALYYQDNIDSFFWLDKKNAKRLFDELHTQWQMFNSNIRSYQIAGANLFVAKKFLTAHNKKLLDLSDNIVKEMLKAKFSQAQINLAGKQRMLSQRMSYQLTVYTNTQEKEIYNEFFRSFEAYQSVILDFYTSPIYKTNQHLYNAIKQNYDFWQEYASYIHQVLTNQEVLNTSLDKINDYGGELIENLKNIYSIYDKAIIKTELIFHVFQYVAVAMILVVIFGLLFTAFWAKKQIKNFLEYSKELSIDNPPPIKIDEDTELAQASRNINDFIQRIKKTKENSLLAQKLGEQIHNEISNISTEIKAHMEEKDLSQEDKEKIYKEIGMSEYIAIQSGDELINITKKLEKLNDSIDKSIYIYTHCLNCKNTGVDTEIKSNTKDKKA